ncbi:MAG: condensation domain-containing protein, partial [Pseudomonadota bacterium]
MWFEQSLAPDSPHYNEAVVLRIKGRLDIPRLSEAFTQVVRRHEILRTTFHPSGDGLTQKVHPPAPVTIDPHSTDEAAPVERMAQAEAAIRTAIRAPFDLASPPLHRIALAPLGEEDCLLAFIVHHVALDGWSAILVFREVFAIYAAGDAAALPDLALQYAEYAGEERAEIASGALDAERERWMERLSGDLPLPPLPFGRTPRTMVSGAGAHLAVTVEADLAGRLRALSRAEGATLFATMAAAFSALLAAHSGRQDILIAAPMTNRDRPELATLAGLFINTVLLRFPARDTDTFRDHLATVRQSVLEAQSDQRTPFQTIVGDLRERGEVAGQPLASVMFDLQRLPDAMDPPGLAVEYRQIDPGTSKFDLGLSVKETDGPLLCTFEFATPLFDRAEIALVARQYLALLARIAAEPGSSLADLLRADADDLASIARWNET